MTSMPMAAYRAHTNIALIKYWGKRNPKLFLPMTSSLSLTLDAFYTDTRVEIKPQQDHDQFWLNHQYQSQEDTQKISRFVDLFRQEAAISHAVDIYSVNHVPTAAGLASSASAFAALGAALNDAFELHLPFETLSTLVRQGSGSASRSLFGGFVQWEKGKGDDSASSYAHQIDDAKDWDIHMLVVVLNKAGKKISSRIGMQQTIETSPFYQLWPETVDHDLTAMHAAIQAHNFIQLGEIAEHNAMKMHATTLAAKPSFTYLQPDSLRVIQCVQELRQEGIPCYVTMDAGPNVKILLQSAHIEAVKQALHSIVGPEQLVLASPGPGPIKLSQEAFDAANQPTI